MKQGISFFLGQSKIFQGYPEQTCFVLVWFRFNCMGNLKKNLFNPSQSFPLLFWFPQRAEIAVIYPHTFRKEYAESEVASYRKH